MLKKKSGTDDSAGGLNSSSSLTEEYGRGSHISAPRFFLFGLLTFWIYSIIKFNLIIKLHEKERVTYFEKLLGSGSWSSGKSIMDELRKSGAREKRFYIFDSVILNLLAITALAFEIYRMYMPLPEFPYKELIFEYPYAGIGLAGLLFYLSSVIYTWRSARKMKDHERRESQLVFFYKNHESSESSKPVDGSQQRWKKFQNKLVFYAVFGMPAALIPYLAVLNINSVMISGGPAYNIYGWAAVLGFVTAFFSYWCILSFRWIYDGHVNFELANKWNLLVKTVDGGRNLLAIMLTDMVGFSKTMEVDEDTAYLKLREHNDAIRKFISLYGGTEVKTMGDAFLVRFNNPIDAVNSAIDIQTIFDRYNQDKVEGERIFLRIGIHYGEVIVEKNDIMGNGVNVTARIEPLAIPGCISITKVVYDQVAGRVKADILRIGRKKLKNISMSQELYMVVPGGSEEMQADKLDIIQAFQKHKWKFSKAAWELGANHEELTDKIKQYGIIYYKDIKVDA
ncbi:MAG: adenylate/guanylate cyclase domain-containing protein [Nitrospinota bacterium]